MAINYGRKSRERSQTMGITDSSHSTCKSTKPTTLESVNNCMTWSTSGIVWRVFILITCFKVLLIPTYHSTDFEVHRNWLAITHSLPIKEWYVNSHSEWTLDYPPFFAWFEYLLSHVAKLFDKEMLKVGNLNYASPQTVFFQRATVIFMDLIFAYGVKEIGKEFCPTYDSSFMFALLSLCNMGLLVVDHIHFQYNGFLFGIFLLSIAKVSKVGNQISVLQGALWFAVLLNFKHIYLYVAPATIIWLLSSYCINSGQFFKRICLLGNIVICVFLISFGPFLSQMPQVLSRLFPFKRGLVHAYWAANAWALYIGVDKALSIIWKYFGFLKATKSAVMTGGLVQQQSFMILPTPTPILTFILTLIAISPALILLLFKKNSKTDPKQFIRCIILCGLSSFMFGWHVHEKAILTAIIPLCVLAVTNKTDARMFLILSSAGHTALLPLLYPNDLIPLKLFLLLTYTTASIVMLTKKFQECLLRFHEYLYICTLPLVAVYDAMLHKLIFGEKLPFLPLAFTSVYCAIGISYAWILYYHTFIRYCYKADNPKAKQK